MQKKYDRQSLGPSEPQQLPHSNYNLVYFSAPLLNLDHTNLTYLGSWWQLLSTNNVPK